MAESAAIVLAAGKSTRMRSGLPKVLHEICGRPMLGYILSACRLAGVDKLIAVVGHRKQDIRDRFAADRDVEWVEQAEQNGTGHAVACCRKRLSGFRGSVVIVAGDMPLVRRETVLDLLKTREQPDDALALATTVLSNPAGYGRIIRDAEGGLEAIVEDRHCTEEQKAICEVNPSYYCFDAERLFDVLRELTPATGTGETYLTDTVGALRMAGHKVSATVRVPPEEAIGINTRLDLARVARCMQDRIQLGLMNEGVTIVDPDNTWIESDVSVGRDTVIHPFSHVGCGATIGDICRIGPYAHVPAGDTLVDGACVGNTTKRGAGPK